MLTDKQLSDVCLVHNFLGLMSDMCRYCVYEGGSFNCAKLSISKKNKIDEECNKIMMDAIKRNVSLSTIGHKFGDNCQGFPFLPNIKQGI